MLVASRGYSGFENKGKLQSPYEEDSFMERTVQFGYVYSTKRIRLPHDSFIFGYTDMEL
jgi:hypothetical protein